MINENNLKKYLETGATLNRNGEAVTLSGYQVSIRNGEQIPADDVGAVLAIINDFLKACPAGAFVGLWRNAAGFVCVDYSENVARLPDAMKKGIEREQDAIFDWLFLRDINLKK